MHPTVRKFGEQVAHIAFGHIDQGSPFVLVGLERFHHYVWDHHGQYAYGRDSILALMTQHIPAREALLFFEGHAESARNCTPLQACVTAYPARSPTAP